MANRWSIQIVGDWEHLGEIDTFQEGRPVIWETWLQGCQLSKINTNNRIWATVKRLRTLSKCDRLELKTIVVSFSYIHSQHAHTNDLDHSNGLTYCTLWTNFVAKIRS